MIEGSLSKDGMENDIRFTVMCRSFRIGITHESGTAGEHRLSDSLLHHNKKRHGCCHPIASFLIVL
jgi:hypothetical protein